MYVLSEKYVPELCKIAGQNIWILNFSRFQTLIRRFSRFSIFLLDELNWGLQIMDGELNPTPNIFFFFFIHQRCKVYYFNCRNLKQRLEYS